MSKPTERDLEKLKKLGRYLAGAPRLIQNIFPQAHTKYLDVWVDTDWGPEPKVVPKPKMQWTEIKTPTEVDWAKVMLRGPPRPCPRPAGVNEWLGTPPCKNKIVHVKSPRSEDFVSWPLHTDIEGHITHARTQ